MFLPKKDRHGSRAKTVKPFKAERIPKPSDSYIHEETSVRVVITLPVEWTDEIRRQYPGARLAGAIRKYLVTSIKLTKCR